MDRLDEQPSIAHLESATFENPRKVVVQATLGIASQPPIAIHLVSARHGLAQPTLQSLLLWEAFPPLLRQESPELLVKEGVVDDENEAADVEQHALQPERPTNDGRRFRFFRLPESPTTDFPSIDCEDMALNRNDRSDEKERDHKTESA